MAELNRCTAVVAVLLLVLVLSGCGGDDEQAVVELPPAGTSRISAVEYDQGRFSQIERYTYGETGLLVAIETWNVAGGVQVGDPVKTVTRTYDSHGRVLDISTREPTGDVFLKATYGADGRLATTTKRWILFGDHAEVMRFTWEGDRMTQVFVEYTRTFDDGQSISDENLASLSYGADGKIASIDWDSWGADDKGPSSYRWRADGQLVHQSSWTGESYRYRDLQFDEQGRLVEMQITDSQYDSYASVRRFRYDKRGRPVLTEIDYSEPGPGADFMVWSSRRVRWEDLPCQPVYEPQMPPTLDLVDVIGAASPIGATLVCSNRP